MPQQSSERWPLSETTVEAVEALGIDEYEREQMDAGTVTDLFEG
jgi:hypothetical protein